MRQAREELVRAGAMAVAAGLSPGQSGNVSVRVGDTLFMSPTNSSLGALDPDALSVLGVDGTHVDGPRPSKEVPLHVALYRRNPGATAVVHVHSTYAVALSCLEPWRDHCAIPPLTPYFLMRVGQVPLIPYFAPGDPRQAGALADNPYVFNGALLANHGSITAMDGVEAALNAAVEIEEVAKSAVLLASAPYRELSEQQVVELTTAWGTPWHDRVAAGVPS